MLLELLVMLRKKVSLACIHEDGDLQKSMVM